jgi:hypothetical protein
MTLLLALLVDVSAGAPSDYFPIRPRFSLEYKSNDGTIGGHRFIGREAVGTQECLVFESASLFGRSAKLYLSTHRGDLRLHKTDERGSTALFDPPLVLLRADARPGVSWTQKIKMSMSGAGLTLNCACVMRAEAFESVRVPAGAFRCLRVRATWEMNFGGREIKATLVTHYAPGIGVVRSARQSGFDKGSIELQKVVRR